MAYINFPIKLLKKIEPLLEGYFNYERSMFHLEFEEIHNIYIQNGNTQKNRKKLISLFHPLSRAILRPL